MQILGGYVFGLETLGVLSFYAPIHALLVYLRTFLLGLFVLTISIRSLSLPACSSDIDSFYSIQ